MWAVNADGKKKVPSQHCDLERIAWPGECLNECSHEQEVDNMRGQQKVKVTG